MLHGYWASHYGGQAPLTPKPSLQSLSTFDLKPLSPLRVHIDTQSRLSWLILDTFLERSSSKFLTTSRLHNMLQGALGLPSEVVQNVLNRLLILTKQDSSVWNLNPVA